MGEWLRAAGHEFGATTGRPRGTGWLDIVALKEAVRTNGLTGIALTKMDVLNELETVKVCTAYKHGELKIRELRRRAEEIASLRPGGGEDT